MRFRRSETILHSVVLLAIAAYSVAGAQQSSTPVLHGRSSGQDRTSPGQPREGSSNRLYSTLPDDVSGEYDFEHTNESIEIDIQHNKLSGYISQLGDAETDNNTPLTFFFDRASVDGSDLEFQTRVVHGVWYSFQGTILRGEGKTRADEGYYVLHGVLQEHHPQDRMDKSADETIARRVVNFKSMRQ